MRFPRIHSAGDEHPVLQTVKEFLDIAELSAREHLGVVHSYLDQSDDFEDFSAGHDDSASRMREIVRVLENTRRLVNEDALQFLLGSDQSRIIWKILEQEPFNEHLVAVTIAAYLNGIRESAADVMASGIDF